MNRIKSFGQKIKGGINKTLHASLKIKILLIVLVITVGIGGKILIGRLQTKKAEYTTENAAKGTLVTSISGTGTISSGNSTDISTAATGTVNDVYIINGDQITKGQKIAELTLDEYGLQQQSYYYAKYIDALHAVKVAQETKDDYDIAMWNARQDILNAEDAIKVKDLDPINPTTHKEWTLSERTVVDKTLPKARVAFDAAELQYKNADAYIVKAQNDVTAAWRNYEEVSSTIYAPATGVVNNLALTKGVVISSSTNTITTSQSSTSGTSITSQKLGKIYDVNGQLQASVSLTESDIINIAPNQKATMTLDAYSDKTFTGKVLAVDTSGSVTSGVTTYPVTILLDKTDVSIYPNMSVTAKIITKIQPDVLLISSGDIDTENGKTVVHVLKNGKASTVEVTTGGSDDTQTEITSGLSEGDAVITNYISANNPSQNNTTSAFSSSTRTNSRNTGVSNRSSGAFFGGPGGL